MKANRRSGALLGALAIVFLSSCTDAGVVTPAADGAMSPSFALTGGTFEAPDFYFLPPLVDEVPTIEGTFNPDLLPSLRVCELDFGLGLPNPCLLGPIVTLPPGSATVEPGRYEIEWDTDGPETSDIHPGRFYRLEILVAGEVQGYVDLDPAPPGTTAPFAEGAFGFFIGETIPVAFWMGSGVLCEGEVFVTECIATAIIDQTGGTLTLDEEGNKLAVTIFENSLPGVDPPPITVTVERIDPALFLAETGTECLPLFDAPQFADCFRVTTIPELTAPLESPALVSICLDPTILDGINLPEEQENQLTMIRFSESGAGTWEALTDVAGECPTVTGSLLRVPDQGLFRYAAMTVNAIADFVAPEPVAARDLRLGGLTSSFSRFRYALPGQMLAAEGDGTLVQAGQSPDVEAVVEVVDHEGLPVENAIVHFESSDGDLSTDEATTGVDGRASVTWTLTDLTAGEKSLTVSALGLVVDEVPEHDAAYFFTTEEFTFTATVVGPPAAVSQTPDGTIAGTAGESAGEVGITVVDAGGNPVSGASVTWEGDGDVIGGTETDAGGTATGEWILPTTVGDNSITATVGGLTATFEADVMPGPAALITGVGGGVSAAAGATIPISVTVTDAFGNARSGDPVVWTVTAGDGTIDGDNETDADGVATADWTLGSGPGDNRATAVAEGLEAVFTATGTCQVGAGSATADGHFSEDEWLCADGFDFVIQGGSDDDGAGLDPPRGTPATVYWMNDDANIYFAVRIQEGSVQNTKSLRLDFDNDGDGRTEYRDDVIGYDVGRNQPFDEHLGRSCALGSGQASCSTRDRSENVIGGISNDGTYTTYELAHPLGGDGNQQDLNREAGDPLGFFLTLFKGEGPWAATQVPGFRDYHQITIVGPTD